MGFDADGRPAAGGGAGGFDDSDGDRFAGGAVSRVAGVCLRVSYRSGRDVNGDDHRRDRSDGRRRRRNRWSQWRRRERWTIDGRWTMTPTIRRRRGTILIVTMCICFLLAGMVLVFCRSMRVEAIASANQVASVSASAI